MKARGLGFVLLSMIAWYTLHTCRSDDPPPSGGGGSGGGGNILENVNNDPYAYSSSYCSYDIDIYSCLNIDCQSLRSMRKFPRQLKEIIPYQIKPNQFLCSIDLSDTGITELSTSDTLEHFSLFYSNLLRLNPNQTTIKLSFSQIEIIRELKFPTELNMVLVIRDSTIRYVHPRSLSFTNKLEINLININMTIPMWINLLEASRLKLLSIRNIQNLKEEFGAAGGSVANKEFTLTAITTITDVKVHFSYLPVLDDHFIFFKLLKSVEQLDLIKCSIAFIKNNIFDKYSATFRSLKYLTLANNNINRITDLTFNGLVNLITLDLDENPIESIHPSTFTSLKRLRVLSLNSNHNSPNVKSLSPQTTNPTWLFNVVKNNRDLREVNFKTNRLLGSYCVLSSIINNIKSYNDYVLNLRNITSGSGPYALSSSDSYRKLRLFGQEHLEKSYQDWNEKQNHEHFCSVYYVCRYTQFYESGDITDLWVVESFRACPVIVTKNVDTKCAFEQKNQECEAQITEIKNKISTNVGPDSTILYSETPGIVGINTLIRNVKAKYFKTKTSVGYIVIGVAILIVTVLLSSCFVYKYKKRKAAASEYYLDEQETQAAVSPQPMPQPHVALPMHHPHRQSVVMISTQPRNSISSRSSQATTPGALAAKRHSIAPPQQQQYHRRSRQFIPEEDEEDDDVVDEDDDDDDEDMDHQEMRVNPVYGNKRSSYQHYPSFSAYGTSGNRYQPQPKQYYVPLAMQKEYRPSRISKSNRSNRSKSLY